MVAVFMTVIARNKHGSDEADSSVFGERYHHAIQHLPKQLSRELGEAPTASTLSFGDIAAAVALDNFAFSLPEVVWQETYRPLASWHQGVITRSSFQTTACATS